MKTVKFFLGKMHVQKYYFTYNDNRLRGELNSLPFTGLVGVWVKFILSHPALHLELWCYVQSELPFILKTIAIWMISYVVI